MKPQADLGNTQTLTTNAAPKLHKRWWFWTLILLVIASIAGASVVVISLLTSRQEAAISAQDKEMLAKYYPDFTLSSDVKVRECQLAELRDGQAKVEAYMDRGESNPAQYHYQELARRCGKMVDDSDKYKAMKPILYLYPQSPTKVHVTLQYPERIDVDYPEYGASGWSVYAYPSSDLVDDQGKKYYALYWDEKYAHPVDFSKGFYVERADAAQFLEQKLTQIGLNDRERNEFIMYWLPKLEHNGKSLVYFELTNNLQADNELRITPAPTSLLRMRMYIKKIAARTPIASQELPHFNRHGFTAVEWGGVEL